MSKTFKKYGINPILERIMIDVKHLEINGICIQNETYYASFAQCCGDNLGIHQVFSIKCCFNGKNICHLCDASTDTIQFKFIESNFKLKTKISYEEELSKNDSVLTGINGNCPLNESKYFHLTKNFMFDITHDIWEGIAPLEML